MQVYVKKLHTSVLIYLFTIIRFSSLSISMQYMLAKFIKNMYKLYVIEINLDDFWNKHCNDVRYVSGFQSKTALSYSIIQHHFHNVHLFITIQLN